MASFGKENDKGNVEYKLKITKQNLEHHISQLLYRINESDDDTAIYRIGVADDGTVVGITQQEFDVSAEFLKQVADEIGYEQIITKQSLNASDAVTINDKVIGEITFKKKAAEQNSIRIAVIGNVDAGKSTLIGHLTSSLLDDGNGLCRTLVMKHPHEKESGRTSYCNTSLMGFTADGTVIHGNKMAWKEICARSAKTISFFDTAGHRQYYKNVVKWFTGYDVDYSLLCISALDGVSGTTKDHIILSYVRKVPIICLITKIDCCPAHIYEKLIADLTKLFVRKPLYLSPIVVEKLEHIDAALTNPHAVAIIPISCKTGQGVDVASQLLFQLRSRTSASLNRNETIFSISEIFNHVKGTGVVAYGIIVSGEIKKKDTLQAGPFDDGTFIKVTVRDVWSKRIPVNCAKENMECTIALAGCKDLREGMYLLSEPKKYTVCVCDLEMIGNYPCTFTIGSQLMLVVRRKRFTALIKEIENQTKIIRCGDKVRVKFESTFGAFFALEGDSILFMEGELRATGNIISLE